MVELYHIVKLIRYINLNLLRIVMIFNQKIALAYHAKEIDHLKTINVFA